MIPAIYAIPPEISSYSVTVQFEGFLPVFGGKNGTASAVMTVDVQGLGPDSDRNPQATSEIRTLSMTLNKAVLPFTPKNIATFFPKTTISYRPTGEILKSDAPDVKLPVRLPGLDAKRFPDITYLPIQFPKTGLEIGKEFTFEKPFGESRVKYSVTPISQENGTVNLRLKVLQTYLSFENAMHAPAKNEADRAFEVSTTVSGEGTAKFSLTRKQLTEMQLKALATSTVKGLSGQENSERKLATILTVKRIES